MKLSNFIRRFGNALPADVCRELVSISKKGLKTAVDAGGVKIHTDLETLKPMGGMYNNFNSVLGSYRGLMEEAPLHDDLEHEGLEWEGPHLCKIPKGTEVQSFFDNYGTHKRRWMLLCTLNSTDGFIKLPIAGADLPQVRGDISIFPCTFLHKLCIPEDKKDRYILFTYLRLTDAKAQL
jgi:hypothetical protein